MCAMTPHEPPEQVGTSLAAQMELLEEIAFDEMNIIELPIALLARDTTNQRAHALSLSGNEKLVADEAVDGLPSALGERVVIALMWFARQRNNFDDPTIIFALRELVTHYVFPGRFSGTYTPGQKVLRAVEEQIRRVAHTRLVSDRWFDRKLNRQVRIDASIIDYLKVVDEGGPKRPRILEIRWGSLFYQSVRNSYTKPIDLATYQRIEAPLDRRLYRWLDRQLSCKTEQTVKSCQAFARFKLAMSGAVVEGGGRAASSYIVKALRESLERLASVGFVVTMAVDASQPDHALTFTRRLLKGHVEVLIADLPLELVHYFEQVAHGIPADRPVREISPNDRTNAERWIDTYGYEQARWMVDRAVAIQKEVGGERILRFAGLKLYESAAAGDYEKYQEAREAQLSLQFRAELAKLYQRYREALGDKRASDEEEAVFETSAQDALAANPFAANLSPATRDMMLRGEKRALRLKHFRVLSEKDFSAYADERQLRAALMDHHGFDPLQQDSN